MIEKRLERIEEMLTQLIQVVGNMNSSQHRMEARLDSVETKLGSVEARLDTMDTRLDSMETQNQESNQTILNQLKQLEVDQDIIWEKLSKGEREIEKIKRRLEN